MKEPNFIKCLLSVLGIAILLTSPPARAQEQAILSPQDIFHPVAADNGMVSSQEAVASRIGVEILRQGGNAIDAAAAVGFALAVTLPRAGNLGGGGFMLIHHAESGETFAIDYREAAPAAATRDMFLDAQGEVDRQKAWFSRHSAGVPGTVAGLALAVERYGSLSLADVLAPAIALAEQGIVVTSSLANGLENAKERLSRWPASKAIFYKPDGSSYQAGERLFRPDLAWTLHQIAEHGPDAFYKGAVAQRIAEDMAANEGLITLEDLANYQPRVRKPVTGSYRGYSIASMPPPSSGGVHLIQILNILEGFPIDALGHNSARTIHLMAEAKSLAYADRSYFLGDPDFWEVPATGLTSKGYAAELRGLINTDLATPAEQIRPGAPLPYESPETTHFSVMDKLGNVVSNTYTLNFSFGSGITVPGTGILLNNEMDDFSSKPGVPNAYGLIGGEANAVEPGKRPLSSMTPTIVFNKDGSPWFATGSPGGSRIITTVLQVIMNRIDHGMNLAAATNATRVHDQWFPDELRIEKGLSPDTTAKLAEMGYRLELKNAMGSTQSVERRPDGGFYGAADPRRPGALAVGY